MKGNNNREGETPFGWRILHHKSVNAQPPLPDDHHQSQRKKRVDPNDKVLGGSRVEENTTTCLKRKVPNPLQNIGKKPLFWNRTRSTCTLTGGLIRTPRKECASVIQESREQRKKDNRSGRNLKFFFRLGCFYLLFFTRI